MSGAVVDKRCWIAASQGRASAMACTQYPIGVAALSREF